MVAWSRLLDLAEADLNRRAFPDARRQAEALLEAPLTRDLRGRALSVAADAAYGMGAYSAAARHYGELIAGRENTPEAARGAMSLGWARLRSGDRHGARAAWNRLADARPDDARAPMALALAAELASQAGDTAGSERLLDRLVTRYPSSAPAGFGRLSRGCLRLERRQQAAALHDLDNVIRVDGPSAVDDRSKISQALGGGDDAILIPTPAATGMRRDSGDPFDRFAARLLDKQHRERTPYLLQGLVLLATQRGRADALTSALARRLVEDFPSYAPGPQLLVGVADAAAAAGRWPLVRQSWETLLAHAPATMAAPRFSRSAPGLLVYAQLLEDLGQGGRARPLLEKVVELGEGDVAAEAAYRLGRGLSAEWKHARAVEWYLTAAYTAERSTWGRKALLGAGDSFAALKETKEALAAYRKLIATRPAPERPEDREITGEAAYRAAEILHGVNLHAEALDMFKTSARVTAGLPTERRALLGALQCVAGAGDRKAAEVLYRRLQQLGGTEAQLALGRQALQTTGRVTPSGSPAQSALPRTAR